MARPYIGPVIDFRVPEEIKQMVEEAANNAGQAHDELCREIFVSAVLLRLSTPPALSNVPYMMKAANYGLSRGSLHTAASSSPPKVAVARRGLAEDATE